MTSAEQARLSQSKYGRPTAPRASAARVSNHAVEPRPIPLATVSGSHGRSYGHANTNANAAHAASRSEGVEAYHSRLKKRRGKRHILRGVLITLFAIILASGVAIAAYIKNIDNNFQGDLSDDFKRQLQDASVKAEDPFYMLLLGVDKSDDRAQNWGDSYANFRADTIILARVDPKGQKISLVSIPRDTYTYMGLDKDDYKDKINGAYSLGGPEQMVKAVEKLSGIQISHYAEIDFEQFTSIVDTVGGIEISTPVDIVDMQYAMIDLPAGTHTVDGTTALAICRARHAYDKLTNVGGDFIRAANQRQVIYAIVKKVLSLPLNQMVTTVSELSKSVTTDFDTMSIMSLAMQFQHLDVENNIYSGQLPTSSEYKNNLWIENVIEDKWATMLDRIEQGLPPYESADEDNTAGLAGTVGNNVTGGGSDTGSGSSDVTPVYEGQVLVLNGTDTRGLAGTKANSLISAGFSATADNASDSSVTTSAVVYNSERPNAHAAALGVAEKLGISSDYVTANTGTYSKDYDVVVILGSDQATQ